MPGFSAKRKRALVRDPKTGRFLDWKGGKEKHELPKQQNNFHGIAVHIGKEFKKQHGRVAKIGDCVRFKTKDGTYHKQAYWYVKTKNGWRRSPTATKKPTKAQIRTLDRKSRPGRK